LRCQVRADRARCSASSDWPAPPFAFTIGRPGGEWTIFLRRQYDTNANIAFRGTACLHGHRRKGRSVLACGRFLPHLSPVSTGLSFWSDRPDRRSQPTEGFCCLRRREVARRQGGARRCAGASFSIRLRRLDEAELRDIGTPPRKQFFLAQGTFKTVLVPRWTLGLDYVVDCPATASKLCHAVGSSGIGG